MLGEEDLMATSSRWHRLIIATLLAASGLLAACGSSSTPATSGAASPGESQSADPQVAALTAQVEKQKQEPTTIKSAQLGVLTPKAGGSIFKHHLQPLHRWMQHLG